LALELMNTLFDDESICFVVERKKNCCGISCDFVTRAADE